MTVTLSPLRLGRVTGSRCAAVLGVDPYKTREGVMREMIRQYHGATDEFVGNPATDWGNANESDALDTYSEYRWVDLHSHQKFVIHPVHDFLGVSVDALQGDDTVVEAKCPWSATYTDLPAYYVPQLQLQLACTGRPRGVFVIWRPSGSIFIDVPADPDWLPEHLPALTAFHAEYEAIIDDPDLSAPFLAPLVDERADVDWHLTAIEYHEADADVTAATARLAAVKQRLIELAGDARRSRGGGVQVIRSERKGSVDYARVVEKFAPDADVEEFRKSPLTVWTVRKAAG